MIARFLICKYDGCIDRGIITKYRFAGISHTPLRGVAMINYHEPLINWSARNPNYIPGCERTWLVQRLQQPRGEPGAPDPWSFGFLKNGGLSQEAWTIVTALCSFDYMGSSEFGMGGVAYAFNRMAKSSSLLAYPIEVSGTVVLPGYCRRYHNMEHYAKEMFLNATALTATVFVLSPERIRPYAEQTINALAKGELRLKERAKVNEALFCPWEWSTRPELKEYAPCAWLELDNGYMFFADRDMWLNFCRLFGVTPPDEAAMQVRTPDFAEVERVMSECPTID
jgi:hypothetical protein